MSVLSLYFVSYCQRRGPKNDVFFQLWKVEDHEYFSDYAVGAWRLEMRLRGWGIEVVDQVVRLRHQDCRLGYEAVKTMVVDQVTKVVDKVMRLDT